MNNHLKKSILIGSAALAVTSFAGLLISGRKNGVGPFAHLHDYDEETDQIVKLYDPETRKREIIFYGASNFRLWKQLETDLREYKVQNHGFGGSTDKLLLKYADKLLYQYEPAIVVFQTGSNDYVGMKGEDEDIANKVIAIKKEMFKEIHENLPEAKFIVLSDIMMPGRDEFSPIVRMVNDFLKEYANEVDYLYYVDSEEMTCKEGEYKFDLFVPDGIHLTHEARLLWKDQYIGPMLEKVIEENGLDEVRR